MTPFFESADLEWRPTGWTVFSLSRRRRDGLRVPNGYVIKLDHGVGLSEVGGAILRAAAMGTDGFDDAGLAPRHELVGFSSRRAYLKDQQSMSVVFDATRPVATVYIDQRVGTSFETLSSTITLDLTPDGLGTAIGELLSSVGIATA